MLLHVGPFPQGMAARKRQGARPSGKQRSSINFRQCALRALPNLKGWLRLPGIWGAALPKATKRKA